MKICICIWVSLAVTVYWYHRHCRRYHKIQRYEAIHIFSLRLGDAQNIWLWLGIERNSNTKIHERTKKFTKDNFRLCNFIVRA